MNKDIYYIPLVLYYSLLTLCQYVTMIFILSTPSQLLRWSKTNHVYILVVDEKEESDSDSDTELLKQSESTDEDELISKEKIIHKMKENNIHSSKFSDEFVSEYINLFFDIHIKQMETYKKIKFIKVELMDSDGIVMDITYKTKYFIKDNYIHIQKLLQFYGNSEFLFILYKMNKETNIYKKIIHLPTKKDMLTNKKCTFGKIVL